MLRTRLMVMTAAIAYSGTLGVAPSEAQNITDLQAELVGQNSIWLTWSQPADTSDITHYENRVCYRSCNRWWSWAAWGELHGTSSDSTSYFVEYASSGHARIQIRPVLSGRNGPESNTAEIQVPNDTTPPTLQGIDTDGKEVFLYYDERLDSASVYPPAGAYTISVDGDSRNPSKVEVVRSGVRLTPSQAVRHGQTVRVSYTVPSSRALQDLAGNRAAAFSDVLATNNAPADDGAGDDGSTDDGSTDDGTGDDGAGDDGSTDDGSTDDGTGDDGAGDDGSTDDGTGDDGAGDDGAGDDGGSTPVPALPLVGTLLLAGILAGRGLFTICRQA